MIKTLLIANRGEIACRIIATAKKMGIRSVAVFSDADRNSRHVKLADQAVHIGPAASTDSYLRADKIIAAAKQTGAEAIHPGYGFLSENEDFADQCELNNIIFVGPPVSSIAAMGSKSAAKSIMQDAGVPLVPGYHGSEQDIETLKAEAEKVGFPLLLKAAYGGGGKGMRVVENMGEFDDALNSAKREAKSSFGNDKMLMERFIRNPRHVEIQVFTDEHGNAVYLAERDCSVQRRHQKVLEEAPAPALTEKTRTEMGEAAIRAAQAIDYVGAGTVEFLFDQSGEFYFMEMNTRLQVEHPVTEMITGQDLVEWQLLVASGQPLPLAQNDIQVNGHAFEARIYAEDPDNDFLPCTGTIKHLRTPAEKSGIRIDTGIEEGDEISAFYDPMIAKLIVWDTDRTRALLRLQKALREYRLTGLTTNVDFLHRLASHPEFVKTNLTTEFIQQHQEELLPDSSVNYQQIATEAALFDICQRQQQRGSSPWQSGNAFRMNSAATHTVSLQFGEETYPISLVEGANGEFLQQIDNESIQWQASLTDDKLTLTSGSMRYHRYVSADHQQITVFTDNGPMTFHRHRVADTLSDEAAHGGHVAPMNGTIMEVLVEKGDTVKKDQPLVIMEAMKMEYTIKAGHEGEVTDVFFAAGDLVSDGDELLAVNETE
ncbi:acetyl/propionyl/methylcrotonyl-CoA carboxylase subunit alpha [Idiomarina sp. PL1-037]|uniref:acetyl/propionyl/methylcrotonyl-CoA carboxylase subunit alpha n=1 Tax=Idiomarina sp. PL1-037 TaxID=3095365 RepID=UPI002ACBE7AF|nr:acetyl/propionyl/methylcrotonyl-CoA carboxylase subunit alpha [Idiomarina sp. PL1-037]WQC54011.1 acetyl/propionyl/methylcrotonyl-CoA carboxylase subunit alpha [Idiomarina sp. PL1-037]